ncbi:MAG TPA: helix-turn-helix domain-containing protein [Opitutaceae bacterium]|jgi:transcriptional regulator with XRE-family HTH domain
MQTIGERLEDARKRKGLSIREAAEATKIRGDYLQKFEANQFNIGLTDIYIRGFLRNYSTFLQLPSDRIVNDYSALGHTETRPRQPNREVYGRMEVSVSSAGGDPRGHRRPGAAAPEGEPGGTAETPGAPAAGPGPGPEPARASLRPLAPMPANRMDPSTVFKFLIWGVGAIVLLVIILLMRALFSSGSPSHVAEHPALASAPAPIAAPEAEAPVTLIATDAVSVRVTSLGDQHEIWSGSLAAGDRHDFPNTGLRVDANPIENLQLEYKGTRSRFGARGHRTGDIPVMR